MRRQEADKVRLDERRRVERITKDLAASFHFLNPDYARAIACAFELLVIRLDDLDNYPVIAKRGRPFKRRS